MDDSFIYSRGAPITLDLVVQSSRISPATAELQMVLKPILDIEGLTAPPKHIAPVATFNTEFREGTETTLPFWRSIIPSEVSEELLPRKYSTSGWIIVDGVPIQATPPIVITLVESNKP